MKRVFLAYANLNFRKNPEGLHSVSRQIASEMPIAGPRNQLDSRIDFLIQLLKSDDPDRQIKTGLSRIDKEHRRIAFDAIFGYRDKFCEKTCIFRPKREALFGSEAFKGRKRITCLECDQVLFRHILHDISRNGLQIRASMNLINLPVFEPGDPKTEYVSLLSNERRRIVPTISPHTGKTNLKWEDDTKPILIPGERKFIFHFYFMARIVHSLTTFLDAKDSQGRPNRHRLLLCPDCCRTFFIPQRLNPAGDNLCSKRCIRNKENRKYDQKTRDSEPLRSFEPIINIYS